MFFELFLSVAPVVSKISSPFVTSVPAVAFAVFQVYTELLYTPRLPLYILYVSELL